MNKNNSLFKFLNLFSSDFLKHFTILLSGGALAQLISGILSPIISRLYTPESFGIFAVYLSIGGFFSLLASARYELAIMLPKEDEDSWSVFIISAVIVIIVSVISLLLVFIFGKKIMYFLKVHGNYKAILFAPLSVLMTGLYNISTYWLLRNKKFKYIAASKIVQSTTQSLSQILMKGLNSFGLILGQIIGITSSCFFLLGKLSKRPSFISERIKKNLYLYSNFPKYNLPLAFIDGIRSNAITFIVSYLFNSTYLGIYFFAMKVLTIPTLLFGGNISQIYFQRSSERIRKGGNIKSMTYKLLLLLIIISAPLFIIIFLFGPVIFSFIFGNQWKEAGKFAKVLSPYIFLSFIASSLSHLPLVLQKQRTNLIFGTIGSILLISSFIIGGIFLKRLYSTLILVSFVMSFYYIFIICWFIYISNNSALNFK